jgi:hypothetical protein
MHIHPTMTSLQSSSTSFLDVLSQHDESDTDSAHSQFTSIHGFNTTVTIPEQQAAAAGASTTVTESRSRLASRHLEVNTRSSDLPTDYDRPHSAGMLDIPMLDTNSSTPANHAREHSWSSSTTTEIRESLAKLEPERRYTRQLRVIAKTPPPTYSLAAPFSYNNNNQNGTSSSVSSSPSSSVHRRSDTSFVSATSERGATQRLEIAMRMLQEKEDNLIQASQIGTALAERNDQLAERNSALELQIEDLQYQIKLADERTATSRRKTRDLTHQITHLEAERDDAVSSLNQIERELHSKKRESGRLVAQVTGATQQAEAKEQALELQVSSWKDKHQQLVFEHNKLKAVLAELQDKYNEVVGELEKTETELDRLQRVEFQCLKYEKEANNAQELEQAIADMQWETQNMTASVRDLQLENSRLSQLHDQDVALFEQMRKELTQLRSRRRPMQSLLEQLQSAESSSDIGDAANISSAGSALTERRASVISTQLSEIGDAEAEDIHAATNLLEEHERLQQEYAHNESKTGDLTKVTVNVPYPVKVFVRDDGDANIEFFMLTVLSAKINMGMQSDFLADPEMSNMSLYRRAKAAKLQFHQYAAWIEGELLKAYMKESPAAGSSALPIKFPRAPAISRPAPIPRIEPKPASNPPPVPKPTAALGAHDPPTALAASETRSIFGRPRQTSVTRSQTVSARRRSSNTKLDRCDPKITASHSRVHIGKFFNIDADNI